MRPRREEKEEKGDCYRCEVSQGSFSRTLTSPTEVTEADAKAQLKDGMLEVTLPKAERARKRAIKIDLAGQAGPGAWGSAAMARGLCPSSQTVVQATSPRSMRA